MTYTSEDFDRHRAGDYTLLARISRDEHALAVLDNDRHLSFITAYDPADARQDVLDILELDFGAVKLAIADGAYSFVPAEVFDESLLQTYRRYLPDDGLTATSVSDLPALGITLLHQVGRMGLERFTTRFPNLSIYPLVQPLLVAMAGYTMQAPGPLVIINKQASSVSIAILDSGRFVYGNDFEVFNPDDFNYYLLAILTNGGLIDKRPLCCLSGNIAADGEFHRRVAKYSDQVVFADCGQLTGIAIPQTLQLEQHQYLTLLGLHLCG
ncbi:DUF3822 family protein [Parapedobacter koreensis]|uniref:DUF3822 family protein n=1 Tax=Parapedobacter koreensis TaxID=332977 RepID=A0A1H7TQN3_9SPHI|nr:DUF3822 family protein [Parapedobacter koreensis]SEL86789.1 Protein of unknown function [Parapedobacter koreensis]